MTLVCHRCLFYILHVFKREQSTSVRHLTQLHVKCDTEQSFRRLESDQTLYSKEISSLVHSFFPSTTKHRNNSKAQKQESRVISTFQPLRRKITIYPYHFMLQIFIDLSPLEPTRFNIRGRSTTPRNMPFR